MFGVVIAMLGAGSGLTQQPDPKLTIQVDVVGRLLAGTNRIDYASEPMPVDVSGRWQTDLAFEFELRDRSKDIMRTCNNNPPGFGGGGGGFVGGFGGGGRQFAAAAQLFAFPVDARTRVLTLDLKTTKDKLTGEVRAKGLAQFAASGPTTADSRRAFAPQVRPRPGQCAVMGGVTEAESKLPIEDGAIRGRTFTFNTHQQVFRQVVDLNWRATLVYDDLLIVTRSPTKAEEPLRFHRPEAAEPVMVNGLITIEGVAPLPQFELHFTNLTPDRAVSLKKNMTADAILAEEIRQSVTPSFRGPLLPMTARPDGSKVARELPASEYRVTVGGLWPGYIVKSIKADSINLLEEPLKVDVVPRRSKPRIQVTLAVDPEPWITISGRVTTAGKPPRGLNTVSLSHPAFREAVEARVDSNGIFVFPKALPGENTLRLGSGKNLREKTIIVEKGGLTNLQIETETPPASPAPRGE
jgi:hypothetical protein